MQADDGKDLHPAGQLTALKAVRAEAFLSGTGGKGACTGEAVCTE